MIGEFLLPMLVDAGHEVTATSRKPHAAQEGVRWLMADLNDGVWFEDAGQVDFWVNFTSLTLLPQLLPQVLSKLKVKRLILFSSTSKYTKIKARGLHDRRLAENLDASEREISTLCDKLKIEWVIFRPTLIYCLGRDKNITLIADNIRRFRFFPVIDSGKGLRQPVHAEDLAKACVQAIASEKVINRAYNLSGKEVLSYRMMVERLFVHLGIPPMFIPVPLVLFRALIAVLRLFPRYHYLTTDMAERMQQDMVFSHDEATNDFGYSPRPFQP